MKTCFNRFLGKCENCDRDYSDKLPNNTHCLCYKEFHIHTFGVTKKESFKVNEINSYLKVCLDLKVYLENAMD